MEKLDDIAHRQVEKLEEKQVAKQTDTSTNTEDVTALGIDALSNLTYDNVFEEEGTAKTPHEELAAQLVRSALDGNPTAIKQYWDIQKTIYKSNAKKPNTNVNIHVKKDAALAQALDNITMKVLQQEAIPAEEVDEDK